MMNGLIDSYRFLCVQCKFRGKQLDVHLEWSTAASGGATTAAEGETVWRSFGFM